MSDKIYFQWQNEFLLKTIYPLRIEKLRDFLVFFEEIELWKTHKNMPDKELDRYRKEYEDEQTRILQEMYQVYEDKRKYFTMKDAVAAYINDHTDLADDKKKDLSAMKDVIALYKKEHPVLADDEKKKYFTVEDVIAAYQKKYPDLKDDEISKVRNLHDDFDRYLDKFSDDPRREKIFVAQRVTAWEQYQKEVNDLIIKQRRRVAIVHESKKEAEQKELDRLVSQLIKMVDNELEQLKTFSSSCNKMEKRKLGIKKEQDDLKVSRKGLQPEIDRLRLSIRKKEDERSEIQAELTYLITRPSVENTEIKVKEGYHWLKPVQFVESKDDLYTSFKNIRKELTWSIANTIGNEVKRSTVGNKIMDFQELKKKIEARIASLENKVQFSKPKEQDDNTQKQQANDLLVAVIAELGYLGSYKFSLVDAITEKTEEMYKARIVDMEKKEDEITSQIKNLHAQLAEEEAKVNPIDERLKELNNNGQLKFVPEKPVSREQIVMNMAEKYRASLPTEHYELLGMIVDLFWEHPERYPLWLQYMVVHFSGMRYASAHGSWADPRELLINIKTSMLEDEFKELVNPEDVDTMCQGRKIHYEDLEQQLIINGETFLKLALSGLIKNQVSINDYIKKLNSLKQDDKDKAWRNLHLEQERINGYIEKLESPNFYEKRTAWRNLRLEEEKADVEAMQSSDVLDALKFLHEDKRLPDWMWNEIVQMTDLRLTEVDSENWETLDPDELAQKNAGESAKYREIMNKWKADNLTDWRSEHDQTSQLVVTRAVCNEVAEHIQHMRGHEGAAGLTEKPNWYKKEERTYDEKWPEPEWDGPRAYFKRPRKIDDFKEGASLLWLRFVNDYPNPWRIAEPLETKEGDGLIRAEYLVKRGEGFWSYDGITRRRKTPAGGTETQYLRWLHEATVAKVAETAEGPVVLTFETALPYENRRLSTIGVFKRFPHDLQHDQGEDGYNPAFVGYVPEAELPIEHFKDMLDWNKILLKNYKKPAEIEKYQKENIKSNVVLPKKVRSTRVSVLSNPGDENPQVGLAPLPANTKLYRTRNWGDPILVKQAGLSAKVAKTSNFNPLPLWSNSGDWSAVVNSLIIPREDIDRLMKLQVDDGLPIKNKMNWLIWPDHDVRPYWCGDGSGWEKAPKIYWGTISFGNQLVLTDRDDTFTTKLPQENEARPVPMKRLVCFTKWDWDKTHETHPWLIQQATEVDGNDKFGDKPKGIIYSPLWSPLDWDFYSAYRPQAFYLPTDWLIEVTPAELKELYPPKLEKNNALGKKKAINK